MTPYERHKTLNHHMSRHSPNAVDIIEECTECFMTFLHNPCIGYPVTMRPVKYRERADPSKDYRYSPVPENF